MVLCVDVERVLVVKGCLILVLSSELMEVLVNRIEFEVGIDWELEVEGGVEVGWGGEVGRKNLILEELNLKY